MQRLLFASLALIIAIACSEPTPEQRAAEAAKAYYDRLVEGFPEDFLEGKAGVDQLPSAYCDQLLQAYRTYLADVEAKHGGISQVTISPNQARRDTVAAAGGGREGVVYAFLLLAFGDSTQEEISVPMVEENGQWRLR